MEQDSTQLLTDAEHTIAWHDATRDALIWWSRQRITRTDAAMLLCGFKPACGDNPLRDNTEETTPEVYRRLLLVFGVLDDNQPLSAWLDIAKDAGLRVHSWLARYKDAKSTLAAKSDGDTAQHAPTAKPAGPCVTKRELIDGLDLVGKTWDERLKRPDRDGKHYLPAVVQRGQKGDKVGTLWNPVIFARLAVEFGDMNQGQVVARFKKAWPKWQDELAAEMGEISP